MEAGSDVLEEDPLLAQLCEELPDLASAREATAAESVRSSGQGRARRTRSSEIPEPPGEDPRPSWVHGRCPN